MSKKAADKKKNKNKKRNEDRKKVVFSTMRVLAGITILSVLLYLFVIPPRFSVVERIVPEELVYEEIVLTVRTNKPLKILSLDKNWLDNYMQGFIYKNYNIDPTIYVYNFSYSQKGDEYIAKLTPRFANIHEECYMEGYKDLEDIEDYAIEFLIRSREKFLLDIKGNKEDFSEVLENGVGVDYQFATLFWLLLQEKGIKSSIIYENGVYYNVVDGKKLNIAQNIYH